MAIFSSFCLNCMAIDWHLPSSLQSLIQQTSVNFEEDFDAGFIPWKQENLCTIIVIHVGLITYWYSLRVTFMWLFLLFRTWNILYIYWKFCRIKQFLIIKCKSKFDTLKDLWCNAIQCKFNFHVEKLSGTFQTKIRRP